MTIRLTSRPVALVAVGSLLAALFFGGAAQAITDTIFRYSSPKPGYLMLSPADFVRLGNSGSPAEHNINLLGITTTSAAQVCLLAPVHLPHGATIKQFRAFYKRPAASDVIFVMLRRINTMATTSDTVANGAQTQAPVTAGGGVTYVANASTNVVNNVQYGYYMYLCIANDSTLMNVRIDYTVTHAGD